MERDKSTKRSSAKCWDLKKDKKVGGSRAEGKKKICPHLREAGVYLRE